MKFGVSFMSFRRKALPLSLCERPTDVPLGAGAAMPKRYRAAIIGLGQIGNQFDDDPKRTAVWTHAAAYSSVPAVELIAGADPDETRLRRFQDRRNVPAGYRDYQKMLQEEAIDLLSVCSPSELHYPMVLAGIEAGVKAIFCEKPLASTVEQGRHMVEGCRSAGVVLAVNHTRRWDSIYREAKRLIDEGLIGRIESITGHYPGKVFTMGTHLFDLMRYYGGEAEWVSAVEVGHSRPEPNLAGHLRFHSGAHGAILCGWDRSNHVFELDLHGSNGRIRISGDGTRLEHWRFEDSPRYSGYRELGLVDRQEQQGVPAASQEDRFVTAIKDLVRCAGSGEVPACSGHDGLAALAIACAMVESTHQANGCVSLERDVQRSANGQDFDSE
jgi:predicted dehydrogenase